jgi:alanyl-tRNA synthetase
VVVLGRERYKGGSRIRFVCGHRALTTLRERSAVLDRLTALFSAPMAALPDSAQRALEGRAAADKRVRELVLQSLDGEAQRLLAAHASEPVVVTAIYDGWDAEALRGLAQRLVALRPCVALLGSRSDRAYVTFAQSDGLPHDIPSLLKRALALFGGRGGGKGNLAQGAGDRLDALDAALAQAAEGVR